MIRTNVPYTRTPLHAWPPIRPKTPRPARPPQRTAADFERKLNTVAQSGGPGMALAALTYMDIAVAIEASGFIPRPSLFHRTRRHLKTMQGPRGFKAKTFKRCFAEGLRCSTEAALRYYGIDPKGVGLPNARAALARAPERTCEQAVRALEQARAEMAQREFPSAADRAGDPACTCRASFDSATSQLTVYIDWFNGPTEATGVHHCVPLFVATRARARRFTFPNHAVNALPKTSRARGYAPFRYTTERVLVPLHAV